MTSASSAADTDALAERAVYWLVLVALAVRLVTTAQATAYAPELTRLAAGDVAAVGTAVIAVDLAVLALFATGRLRPFVRSPLIFGLDVAACAGANAWIAWSLPEGTLVEAGQDTFWPYWCATVAVWSALYGRRIAAVLLALSMLLLAGMLALNDDPENVVSWDTAARYGWAVGFAVLSLMVVEMARHGARLAASEGVRAGQEAARASVLRELHETVLQTLGLIVKVARDGGLEMLDRRDRVRDLAQRQAAGLRDVLAQPAPETDRPALLDQLSGLAARFRRAGLEVESHLEGLDAQVPANRALLVAVREALQNVHKHSGCTTAVLVAERRPDGWVEVTVRDRGKGFEASATPGRFGLAHAIRTPVVEAGGRASVESAPGQGASVRLEMPPDARDPTAGLAERAGAVDWYLVAPLVIRLLLLPLVAVGGVATLGTEPVAPALPAMCVLVALNIVMLARALTTRRSPGPALRLLDLALASAWAVWAALSLPDGSMLQPGPDMPWPYLWSTVAVWTAVSGARFGLGLAAAGSVLGMAAALVNGAPRADLLSVALISRQVVLFACAGLVLLVMRLANLGVHGATAGALEMGAARERAGALAELHVRALDTFDAIVAAAGRPDADPARVLEQVAAMALVEDARLRGSHGSDTGGLADRFEALHGPYRARGLELQIVTAEVVGDPPAQIADALLACSRWALDNVCRHAGVGEAHVWVSASPVRAEVKIRDHGCGFTPPEGWIPPPAADLLTVGGCVRMWSTPGRGTRVELRWGDLG